MERLSQWSAKIVYGLIFVLISALTYEITVRYFFGSPTVWAYDATYMLYGTFYMLGAAYTLMVEGHVRVDAIYSKMSSRRKLIVDIIGYLVFFFPSIGALLYFGIEFAWESWRLWEKAKESIWAPPIYPFKTILPLATFLLLLQGIAKFIQCLNSLRGKEE